MKLTKKRGKRIILIILIALALFSIYILKSGSESFATLDVDNVESINDPVLQKIVEATEECNKIGTEYRNACYSGIAWHVGYYENPYESLKEELRQAYYWGYGEKIGKEHNQNITIIQEKCSKTKYYEDCILQASIRIGQESAKPVEQCKKIEQEDAKRYCHEGLGRQLAKDNKEQSLCEKVENKESCLIGYSFIKSHKGNKEKAIQICNELSGEHTERCYFYIGIDSTWIYNKTIKEAFKECEQYPHLESCKQGATMGVAFKSLFDFFEKNEKQQENIFIPTTFAVYKAINPPITKTGSILKQQAIPHLINHKLTYLLITFSSLQIILAVRILKNKRFQKTSKEICKVLTRKAVQVTIQAQKTITKIVKESYSISTQTTTKTYKIIIQVLINKTVIPGYNFSKQKLLALHKELKLVIRDVTSVDTKSIGLTLQSIGKELTNKETQKRILIILALNGLAVLALAGNVHLIGTIGKSFVAATAGGFCDNEYDATADTYRLCADTETCCDASQCSKAFQANFYCYNATALSNTDSGDDEYDYDRSSVACERNGGENSWWCGGAAFPASACTYGAEVEKSGWPWTWTTNNETTLQGQCCGDDAADNLRRTKLLGTEYESCCDASTDCVENDNSTCTTAGYGSTTVNSFYCDQGNWGGIECSNGCFYVQNSTSNVTIIEKTGNMSTRGALTQDSAGTPAGNDDLIFEDTAGITIAHIDGITGNMFIAKKLHQEQNTYCTTLTKGAAFEIRDDSGNCVAFLNSTGDLWLRGGIFQNVVF